MNFNIQSFFKLILFHVRKWRENISEDHKNHKIHTVLGMNGPEKYLPHPG